MPANHHSLPAAEARLATAKADVIDAPIRIEADSSVTFADLVCASVAF